MVTIAILTVCKTVLCIFYICEFCVVLTVNRDYFLKQC
jgi:hypothetical protein